MSDVAPGWYPDATNPLQERLWDGSAWVDKVRPKPPVSSGLPNPTGITSYAAYTPTEAEPPTTFGEAIREGAEKYSKFSGRSSRRAYWFFYLFYLILAFITALLPAAWLSNAVQFAFLLPTLAFACRRLHDSDKSGWFILVPIYNLVLLCKAGDPHDNRYGSKVR